MTNVLILVVCGLVLLACAYLNAKNKSKLKNDGSIIDRAKDFVEFSEEFTTRHLEETEFADKFNALDALHRGRTRINIEGNYYIFKQPNFSATIYIKEQSEEKDIYVFSFRTWGTDSTGRASDLDLMNLFLTSIEKIFLSLDPNTTVTTKKNNVKKDRS